MSTTARVTQEVIEVIIPLITRSPSTPTGAAVTQEVVEAIIPGPVNGRVTQFVVEAIVALDNPSTSIPPSSGESANIFG